MAGGELLTLGAALVAVAVAGAVATRAGASVIPLYVVAGVAVGPFGTGSLGLPSVPASETLTLLGEVGVVLLLFFLGVEFSIERLVAARERMTKAGAVDLLVNLPLGVLVGLALGWSAVEALLLGGIVYISSSAIITKSLLDSGWIANPESEPILGVLVFEDLVVAVYLAVVTVLARGTGDPTEAARGVAIAMGFLLVLGALVAYGDRLFEGVLADTGDESFVIRALALVTAVGGLALSLGVSEAVAAFFVGMGFATTGHVERIEHLLSPLRDAFAAVFFFGIGVATDPRAVLGVVGVLALVVALTAPAKVLTGYLNGRTYDLSPRRSLRVGLALVARGEFSLVIAAVAATGTGPTMTRVIPALAVGYVLVMSLLGTGLLSLSDRIEAVVFPDA
jgi:CPA2 family monovalent cation:H+ antiporter-2